ncbi:MAG: hypothetical protein HY836_03395 [Aquabacterium sp.]|uniref:hypothetical protein n=1 Tax=Aquabacterium sp. TaxID=1872578 RepID=UPI0025BAF4F4|nr:hypothetical protein [Aquabacterium sp.]MBI5924618.1 hypothetical protein [Aquabacterium sp.]
MRDRVLSMRGVAVALMSVCLLTACGQATMPIPRAEHVNVDETRYQRAQRDVREALDGRALHIRGVYVSQQRQLIGGTLNYSTAVFDYCAGLKEKQPVESFFSGFTQVKPVVPGQPMGKGGLEMSYWIGCYSGTSAGMAYTAVENPIGKVFEWGFNAARGFSGVDPIMLDVVVDVYPRKGKVLRFNCTKQLAQVDYLDARELETNKRQLTDAYASLAANCMKNILIQIDDDGVLEEK